MTQPQPIAATPCCNICGTPLPAPIYQAAAEASLTSLSTRSSEATTVRFCNACSHCQTDPLADAAGFYASEYSTGTRSAEEDQLMKVENGIEIYRSDYQKDAFIRRLAPQKGMRVLDFGCGKAETIRKILAECAGVEGFAFDVSEDYIPFWQKFLPEGHYAAHHLPETWQGSMDVVMSFFMLEHVATPLPILETQHRLLASGGQIYCIVPDMYRNPADMLVVDHINHFSRLSLRWALEKAGFTEARFDDSTQWMIVTARKSETTPALTHPDSAELLEFQQSSAEIARYWQRMREQVAGFLRALPSGEKAAIYGAGFYGSFIWEHLPRHEQIACFIDRNIHMHGHPHNGRPVLPPEKLDAAIHHVFVGLNPQIAEAAMREITPWQSRELHFHYLL